MGGNLDFSTPVEHATRVLVPVMPNAREVVLADAGHVGDLWGVNPAGTERLIASFLMTGVADTSGLEHSPVSFDVAWGFPSWPNSWCS